MVESKGFKTGHFLEPKTARLGLITAAPDGHVECPESEPADNDIQFSRSGLVPARIARELGISRETVGRYLLLRRLANPAISTPGKSIGRKSQREHVAEVIMAKVEAGLSAQRIYQDLVEDHGFSDSYQSVKRFVRKLRALQPERIWRLECQPGEEVQVDFGRGAPIEQFAPCHLSLFLGITGIRRDDCFGSGLKKC
jgi:transposase